MEKGRIGSYGVIIEAGYFKLDDSKHSEWRGCTEEYGVYNHLCRNVILQPPQKKQSLERRITKLLGQVGVLATSPFYGSHLHAVKPQHYSSVTYSLRPPPLTHWVSIFLVNLRTVFFNRESLQRTSKN